MLKQTLTDLSVDLRDAIGDRLYLTSAFRRDGTKFDASSATLLKCVYFRKKSSSLSPYTPGSTRNSSLLETSFLKLGLLAGSSPSGVSLSRRSNLPITTSRMAPPAVFTGAFLSRKSQVCIICQHLRSLMNDSAANLHVTTLGHGYQTNIHVDHSCRISLLSTEYCFN